MAQREIRDRRAAQLGFEDFAAYLESPHWQRFLASWRLAQDEEPRCQGCHGPRWRLWHRHYRSLGCEKRGDVIPLCDDCCRSTMARRRIHDRFRYYGRKRHAHEDFTPPPVNRTQLLPPQG